MVFETQAVTPQTIKLLFKLWDLWNIHLCRNSISLDWIISCKLSTQECVEDATVHAYKVVQDKAQYFNTEWRVIEQAFARLASSAVYDFMWVSRASLMTMQGRRTIWIPTPLQTNMQPFIPGHESFATYYLYCECTWIVKPTHPKTGPQRIVSCHTNDSRSRLLTKPRKQCTHLTIRQKYKGFWDQWITEKVLHQTTSEVCYLLEL